MHSISLKQVVFGVKVVTIGNEEQMQKFVEDEGGSEFIICAEFPMDVSNTSRGVRRFLAGIGAGYGPTPPPYSVEGVNDDVVGVVVVVVGQLSRVPVQGCDPGYWVSVFGYALHLSQEGSVWCEGCYNR